MPILEIQDICKTYQHADQTTHALQNVSFTVEKGDVFGIIGLSGAGKSTLIRCLSSLIMPTSGKIFFHSEDISKMNPATLRHFRKKIGMIFQHFNLLSSRTVEGNVLYPLEIANISKAEQKKRTAELLELVGLKEKKQLSPSKLSGGEKQRVGIARALATHPEVLLCDEATSALDPKTTRDILKLLKNINQQLGVTIVLITHEMEVIKQICNHVAVIEGGKIVETGLVIDIFADPKHQTTAHFLQNTSHEIPTEFFKTPSPNRKLLRLKFKGKVTSDPIISEMTRQFHVNANILLGWIDRLQNLTLGTLVIELTGPPDGISAALKYLHEKGIHYEEIHEP